MNLKSKIVLFGLTFFLLIGVVKAQVSVNTYSPFYLRTFTLTGGVSTTTGAVLYNNNWYVGIGTSTPYAPLSVVGEIVGAFYTATTTATSTYAGGIWANDLKTNLVDCNTLDTDSTGAVICGSDAT